MSTKQYRLSSSLPIEYIEGWLQFQLRIFPEIKWKIENGIAYIQFEEENQIAHEFLKSINRFLVGEYECVKIPEEQMVLIEDDNASYKELPLSEEKSKLTHSPYHLLQFQIPILNDVVKPWYYANFINLVLVPGQYVDYTDAKTFYSNIFDGSYLDCNSYINYNNENCFTEYLNKNYYIISYIDFFYISHSRHYQKDYHDVHQILIYGYDLNNRTYKCLYFDAFNPITKVDILFDEIHMGIESARLFSTFVEHEKFVMFIKVRELNPAFNNCFKRILNELIDYSMGKGDRTSMYFITANPILHDDCIFGMDITKSLIWGLRDNSIEKFDYRMFHLVADSKNIIYERLTYVKDNIKLSENAILLIDEYQKIAVEFEIIRNRYFKESMKQTNFTNFYEVPQKSDIINYLIEKINNAYLMEKEVLRKIIPLLIEEVIVFDKDYLFGKFKLSLDKNDDGKIIEPFFKLDSSKANEDMDENLVCLNLHSPNSKEYFEFKGIDDYIQISKDISNMPLSKFTCSLCLNITQYPLEYATIINKNNDAEEIHEFRIIIDNYGRGHTVVETENDRWYSNGTVAEWANSLELNKWHNIIVTYDGCNVAVFINGQLSGQLSRVGKKEISGNINKTNCDFLIGCDETNNRHFNGKMREIELYNESFNSTDAMRLYVKQNS